MSKDKGTGGEKFVATEITNDGAVKQLIKIHFIFFAAPRTARDQPTRRLPFLSSAPRDGFSTALPWRWKKRVKKGHGDVEAK